MQLYHLTSTSTYTQAACPMPAVKNYLFIVPCQLGDFEKAILQATAKRMSQFGYVYVADVSQSTMEDRDNVRYMPLHLGRLPCFGSVESVIVFHDEGLIEEAAGTYPGARFFVLNPAQQEEDITPSPCLSITDHTLAVAT